MLVLQKLVRYQSGPSRKLAPTWEVPHRVVYAPTGAPTVILRLFDDPSGKHDRVHITKLKKYVQRSDV